MKYLFSLSPHHDDVCCASCSSSPVLHPVPKSRVACMCGTQMASLWRRATRRRRSSGTTCQRTHEKQPTRSTSLEDEYVKKKIDHNNNNNNNNNGNKDKSERYLEAMWWHRNYIGSVVCHQACGSLRICGDVRVLVYVMRDEMHEG